MTVTDVNGAGSGTPSVVHGHRPVGLHDRPAGHCHRRRRVADAGGRPGGHQPVVDGDRADEAERLDRVRTSRCRAVTVDTTRQVMEGALNPVTVTDVRGGTAGWSLTASLSGPFTEVGSGQIASSARSSSQVGCAPLAGSATRDPGSGGTLVERGDAVRRRPGCRRQRRAVRRRSVHRDRAGSSSRAGVPEGRRVHLDPRHHADLGRRPAGAAPQPRVSMPSAAAMPSTERGAYAERQSPPCAAWRAHAVVRVRERRRRDARATRASAGRARAARP